MMPLLRLCILLPTFFLLIASLWGQGTSNDNFTFQVTTGQGTRNYNKGACGWQHALFGGSVTADQCGEIIWGYDITPDSLVCDTVTMNLTGKWALIRRGTCPLDTKAWYAQQAGARGVIIVNHYAFPADDSCSVSPINGTTYAGLITIPCIFVCREVGEYIDAGIQSGQPVQGCCVVLPCVALTTPVPTSTGVSVNTSLHWPPTSGPADGYHLSLGTTPGGSELLNNQTVPDTFFQPAQPLPAGDTVYVRIKPFNDVGEASGCAEYWFVTAGCPPAPLPCSYPDSSLTNGLVVWLPFDNHVCDVSGNNNNGTANGGFTYAADRFGNPGAAGNFNASNSYVSAPSSSSLNSPTNSITLAGWAKANLPVPELHGFITKINSSSIQYRMGVAPDAFNHTKTNFYFGTSFGSELVEITGNADFQKWNHYAVTWNGSELRFFLNGKQVGQTKPFSGTISPSTSTNLDIGRDVHGGVEWTDGVLDDLRVYNRALTPNEIKLLAGIYAEVSDSLVCSGQPVTLSSTIPGANNYLWRHLSSNTIAGTSAIANVIITADAAFEMTAMVDTCVFRDTVYVKTDSLKQTFSGLGADTVLCEGQSIQFVVSAPPGCTGCMFVWSDGETDTVLNDMPVATTQYSVTVTDPNGCTATASVTVTVDSSGLDCGLVAHYPLDGNVQDISGNNLNGQNFGATPARDRFENCDRAMYFNNTWIGVPHDERLNFTGDFSLSFWFKKAGNTFGHIIGKGQDNVNSYYFTANNGPNQDFDAFSVFNSPQSDVLSIAPTETQKWHHAICIYDKTDLVLYLLFDGLPVAGKSVTNSFTFNNVHPLVLGRHCTNANGCGGFPYFFNGWIDEVRIYNRALRPAEFTELFNQPNSNPNLPDAAATGGALGCATPVVQLHANSAIQGVTYAWTGPNSFTSATQNPFVNTAGTYTVTVTNPIAGCTSTATATVTGNTAAPDASVSAQSGAQLNCTTAAVTLQAPAVSGYTYAWSGGLGTNDSATVTQPGLYTVTVTNPANGCTATGTAIVTLDKNAPDVAATGGTLTCAQAYVLLQGASTTPGVAWSWAGPGGFGIAQPSASVGVPGVYTLTVSNPANGCTATATASVSTNYTPPPVSINAPGGLQITCALDSIPLQGVSTPNATFAWTGPNGYTASTVYAVATAPGAYTLTVTNPANGCTATATAGVGVNQTPPPATVTPATALLTCAQPTATLQATGGFSYAWAGPSGFAFAADKPVVYMPGVYTVTVTGSGNGCTATATAVLTENKTLPGASATGVVITCAQPVPMLQGSSPTAGVNWNWTGPGNYLSTQQNPPVSAPGAYLLIVTNPTNGCTSTTAAIATQDMAAPTLTATGGRLSCGQPSTAALQAGSGTPGVLFHWEGPAGFQVNGPTPVVNLAGLYTCTATDTANGCTAVRQVTVEPPLVLQPTIFGPTQLCPGGTLTLNAGGGYDGYKWSNGTAAAQNSVSQPGPYTVTVTDAALCTGTASAVVTAAQPPAPVISGPPVVCTGSSAVLDAGAGYATYAWSTGANGQTATVFNAGVYSVTVSDGNHCTGTASLSLGIAASPNPGAGSNSPVCAGDALKLITGNNPGWIYAWAGPGGFVSTQQNPVLNPATTEMSGQYSVTVTDNNQCTGAAQVSATVYPAYFFERDTAVCPDNTLLDGRPATSDTTIILVFELPGTGCDSVVVLDIDVLDTEAPKAVPDDTYLLPGESELTFKVTANDTPTSDWTLSIARAPALGNATAVDRNSIRYTRNAGASFLSDTLVYALCPLAFCPGPCDSATVVIRLQGSTLEEAKAVIPNGFIPDSPIDSNRVFDPVLYLREWGIDIPPDRIRFIVFNRWGEVVHFADPYTDMDGPWDGRHNDRPLPQGTYYYRLIFMRDDREEILEGPVYLLR